MMGMMGYGWGMMGSGWSSMFLIPLAFIILIVLGAYFITTESTRPSSHRNISLEILKERYARGEISSDEFEKMRNNL